MVKSSHNKFLYPTVIDERWYADISLQPDHEKNEPLFHRGLITRLRLLWLMDLPLVIHAAHSLHAPSETTTVVESIKLVKGKEIMTRMKTCSDVTHQEMEHLNSEQSKANYQLSQELMCQKVAHPNGAMADWVNLTSQCLLLRIHALQTQRLVTTS
jgi:hypothetical protein